MVILIKNAYILTMDKEFSEFTGNILIENDKIVKISKEEIKDIEKDTKIIDAKGKIAMPGFVQPHIHLCQTLMRGIADDMELLDWLKLRIWPFEGAHDEESLAISAKLGLAELIKGGTTSIVDMETVHHTDLAINEIYKSGIRAITGKVMMDYGSDVPKSLMETCDDSIKESVSLLEKWHGADGGRIQYAFTPRFVVSCSEKLLLEVAELSKFYKVKVHTHASENRGEIAFVEVDRGMRNIDYLKKVGLLSEDLILVHCIWLNDLEMEEIKNSGTKIVHCPSSNMKLASGVCRVPELSNLGIDIGIAADGAPCNNRLDIFSEMKLASLMQKVRLGPTVMNCKEVLYMATMGGAKVMGLQDEIGSLEMGKKADVILMNLNSIASTPSFNVDVMSSIVYSASSNDVDTTIVNGKILMENRKLTTLDEGEIIENSNRSIERLWKKLRLI